MSQSKVYMVVYPAQCCGHTGLFGQTIEGNAIEVEGECQKCNTKFAGSVVVAEDGNGIQMNRLVEVSQ